MINSPPAYINPVYRPSFTQVVGRVESHGKPIHFGELSPQAGPNQLTELWREIQKASLRGKLIYIFFGLPVLLITLFLKNIVCPNAEEGYTLAHERGEKSSFHKALDRSRAGRPPLPENALEMDSIIRTLKFMFWGQFGSDALVKATVHLDPDYKPYKPNWQMHKAHKNDEEELCDLNEDLQKYEIPDPPPKLGLLDRF